MEGGGAALRATVRAEDCRSTLLAKVADKVLELVVGEEEVVQLSRGIVLLLPLLHLLSPHGAIDMDELIDLEWYQAPCNGSFTVETAQEALQAGLRVLYEHVLFLTELRCHIHCIIPSADLLALTGCRDDRGLRLDGSLVIGFSLLLVACSVRIEVLSELRDGVLDE